MKSNNVFNLSVSVAMLVSSVGFDMRFVYFATDQRLTKRASKPKPSLGVLK